MLTLSGRTAIITGGSRGIGFAIADEFAKNGMNIGIVSIRKENAEAAAKKISSRGDNAVGFQCDVTNIESIRTAISQVAAVYGGIDVVVNCAGILDLNKIENTTEDEWNLVLDTNLKGAFFFIQQALPYLENSKAARIINISSNAGRMGGFENGIAYTASKGGMISMTYGIARRLAPKGITVNCVAPGTIISDMSNARDEASKARLLTRFPIGRMGRPEEVAAACCYFASEESGFTTGAVLDINGGLFMG